MIERLPEGKSIGWMQAPPNWIFTHTVRFIGIVRVVIQDGEGFILINKGKPLTYYFKHGRIELRGHAAHIRHLPRVAGPPVQARALHRPERGARDLRP